MSWVDHMEGTLAADDLRYAFVAGAQWWLWHCFEETMMPFERDLAEAAAEARYPGGRPPEPTESIPARAGNVDELLAVGLRHLVHAGGTGDQYAAAVVAELRRLYRAAGEPLPVLLGRKADSVTYTLTGETVVVDVTHGDASYTLDVGRAA